MQRGQEFIGLYNRLDTYLRDMIRVDGAVTFTQLVNTCAEKSTPVRRHSQALRRFGDLRNAIIHYRDYPPILIAEPSEDALIDFQRIVEDITNPPKLLPRFKQEVQVFELSCPLTTALIYMKDHDYSQVVTRREGKLGLLTVEGVAGWLRERAVEEIIDIQAAKVGDALDAAQASHMLVLSSRHTVFDAQEAFVPTTKRPRLYAIIITSAGKDTEMPLGLVTPWDSLQGR